MVSFGLFSASIGHAEHYNDETFESFIDRSSACRKVLIDGLDSIPWMSDIVAGFGVAENGIQSILHGTGKIVKHIDELKQILCTGTMTGEVFVFFMSELEDSVPEMEEVRALLAGNKILRAPIFDVVLYDGDDNRVSFNRWEDGKPTYGVLADEGVKEGDFEPIFSDDFVGCLL